MFSKILIANRGEIACRVIRTARRMGIATVAVHSDADAEALHVWEADEAVAIGPAAAAASYLVAERIVEACRESGAEAVHPGYGFLSENTGFAEALAAAGIAFIGPAPKAIAAMGDKIESKRLAAAAGVSTVPGHMDVIADADEAVRIAREIGYPVMIKASAGGGGKGMRVAHDDGEARDGFGSARNEARSSFADDRVFIEKFIVEPRHIEIQVLADGHGKVLHLGERECSIQRRHQKVIEEAPSPFLTATMRKAMAAQAVALAKSVDYRSAGTVEFIADTDRNFYFLEMNTRLQVEHPVTEMITGLDLVEQMIRVAAGEKLKLRQADIKPRGWAMEARIYAEDSFRGFMPSIGRLVRYREPEGDGVRVDSGVYEGAEISVHYDPMIAKLVAHGATRNKAIDRLSQALDGYCIRGVTHNAPFLAAVLSHKRFRDGRLSTNFIDDEYPDGFSLDHTQPGDPRLLAAVAAVVHSRTAAHEAGLSGQLPGHRAVPGTQWVVQIGEARLDCRVAAAADGEVVKVGRKTFAFECDWRPGLALFTGRINRHAVTVQIERRTLGYRLFHGGALIDVQVLSPFAADLMAKMPRKAPPDLSRFLLSPMPGLLVSLSVAPGQDVKVGETLAVVEAMKMENVLRAARDGVVATLHAEPGASLAVDQAILEFE